MAAQTSQIPRINNEVYVALGQRWYEADDDPVALLRAEARLRNPWVNREVVAALGPEPRRVLDVGCGGGFLANDLAALGHHVTGLDSAADALHIAGLHDASGSVQYRQGDALALPFADASFDVVCAMDFLEHVDAPDRVIAEAARVLRPSGLFFFHTFNRNLLSWLVVIKGVEWFVRNTPRDLHVLSLFLKPSEVAASCTRHGLSPCRWRGVRPKLGMPFWRMLFTGRVNSDFEFAFTSSTALGYSGFAQKRAP